MRRFFAVAAMVIMAILLGMPAAASAHAGLTLQHQVHSLRARNNSWLHLGTQPKPVAIFLVPHADDETLSFGAAIRAYELMGYRPVLDLLTDGAKSGARELLAAKGYKLTTTEFIAARRREFRAAAMALGVVSTDLWYSGVPDGGLTVETAVSTIKADARRWPGAVFITESPTDVHPDHRALGLALGQLVASGEVNADSVWSVYAHNCRTVPLGERQYLQPSARDLAATQQAVDAYRLWKPNIGRYAIGGRFSVPDYFEDLATTNHVWLLVHIPH